MSRRITQATFDEAVEENVREFGMSREEAVADAVAQFEASGVDLDGIVRDGSNPQENPVISAVQSLKQWVVDQTVDDTLLVRSACNVIYQECARNVTNKNIARSNGGVTYICASVMKASASGDDGLRKCSIDALRALCANSDDCRGEVDAKEIAPVLLAASSATSPLDVRRSSLLCAAVLCVKREGMKTALFEGGLPDTLTAILQQAAAVQEAAAGGGAPPLVREACVALSRLLTDDDLSILASNAYAYARTIASTGVVPQALLKLLQTCGGDDVTVAEVYSALRSVTVNEDVCRQVDAAGGIAIITNALAQHTGAPIRVSAATLGLVSGSGAGAAGEGADGAGGMAQGGAGMRLGTLAEDAEEAGEADPVARDAASTVGDGESVGARTEADPADIAGSEGGSVGSAGGGAAGVVAAALEAAAAAAATDTETTTQRRIRMLRCGLAVLRTLANSDPNKVKMGEGPTLGLLLQVLQTGQDVPPILEQAVAALGNLCLRLPSNAERVFSRGGLQLIARAMARHPGYGPIQRSACLTLRNIIARSPERIQAAFDEGFENLLQAAYVRHPTCRDVSYACLRDMGCSYAETTIGRAQADRAARAIAANNIRVQ